MFVMTLQPPSFFQTAGPHKTSKQKRTSSNLQEEVDQLRQENKALRQKLEVNFHPTDARIHLTPLQTTALQSKFTTPPTAAATLTSDLLEIEDQLQSRVKLLEAENKKASLRVLQLEKTLTQCQEEFHEQVERLNAECEARVQKVESEKETLCLEYETCKELKEKQVGELEERLAAQHELNTTQVEQLLAKNTQLEQSYTVLKSDRAKAIQSLEEKVAILSEQLAVCEAEREAEREAVKSEHEAQLSSLSAQVSSYCEKIRELEAYLGGEIPELREESKGCTWKEERTHLCCELQKYQYEAQRLQSENVLLNIRLDSLSEILGLQETDISKKYGEGVESVKCLLKRWREKVFVLLVQRKLEEIESARRTVELQAREASMAEEMQECEQERQLLSHALADRTAQLQLQETKTLEKEREVEEAKTVIATLESQLHSEQCIHVRLNRSIRTMADLYNTFKIDVNQALTKMNNYEIRLAFAIKRIQSFRATLNCQSALLPSKVAQSSHMELEEQLDGDDDRSGGDGVLALTREQLGEEVRSLCQERDNLIGQLEDSTRAFQQQLQSLEEKFLSERKDLERGLLETSSERDTLRHDLTSVQSQLCSCEEEKRALTEKTQTLERDLKELQASMDSRIMSELDKQKLKNREELGEMEKLLNVARREHSKVVLQLQQLSRQLSREKERAVEAAEVGKAGLERELADTRKKLQSVQVERNLLLTTLRQEGIVTSLRQRTRLSLSNPPVLPPPANVERTTSSATRSSEPGSSGDDHDEVETQDKSGESEDIREVLKDLQMLSASLLSMEPQSATQEHSSEAMT